MPSTRRGLLTAAGAASVTLAGCSVLDRTRERLADARREPPERRVPADWRPGPGTWAGRAHGPTKTGYNPHAAPPRSEPTVDWRVETSDPVLDLVVADGVVYAGTTDGLYAFDATDGTEQWHEPLGANRPLWRAGRLYVALETADSIGALTPDGERLWQTETFRAAHDVLERDGWVYVASPDGTRRIHADTGAVVGDDGPAERWLTSRGGPVYTGDGFGRITAYDAGDDGGFDERWTFHSGERIPGWAVVSDATVVVSEWSGIDSDDEHALVALEAPSGEERARTTFDHQPTAAALVGRTAYVSTYTASDPGEDGGFAAVDVVSGDVEWTFEPGRSCSRPVGGGEAVYVPPLFGGGTEPLVAFDRGGEELWRRPVSGRDPTLAVAGETLYVGDGEELHALRA